MREIDDQRLRRYELPGGWLVVAGRTDADNEYVSLELARADDTWFHTSACPGSHVLLLARSGQEPDRETVRAAAAVAAWHSKARGSGGKVEVHVCRAGDVRKPRGFGPGKVRITRWRSIRVYAKRPPDREDPQDPRS